MVRKLGFPVRAEGRGSSAEAFLRGRVCGSSSFQNPGLSTCKSNQLCMSVCHLNHFTTTEALNKATKMFSGACMSSWALGPLLQVIRKAYPGTRRSRKLRGRSAEARKSTLDPYPCPCFRNPFFSPMGNPNELLLVRLHVAAASQFHSYGIDLLSLWPRVASKSQLDLHNPLYLYSHYHIMRAHPVTCFSTYPRQRSQPKTACAGTFAVVFEDLSRLSRKQIPKSSRKTFAEAAAEGGSKKDYKCGRYAEGPRGRRSVSVTEFRINTTAHMVT